MPCGSIMKKQCQHCCAGEEIEEISSMEEKGIQSLFDDFQKGILFENQEYSDLQKMPQEVRMAMELIQKKEKIREEVCRLENAVKELLGTCGHCGESLIFNVVQAKEYDEKGYLKNWEYYTKWLYGSMNRKLLILELGTAQTHPGLFGDAFQKICELNPKAERFLFQAENFENAIDWLAKL